MLVLICGSREWDDGAAIRDRIAQLPSDSIVLHGGAAGADSLAGAYARDLGLHVAVMHALWGKYGKRAGYLRNQHMLALGPDLVIAFTVGSRGTQHTINMARSIGIPVEIHGMECHAGS